MQDSTPGWAALDGAPGLQVYRRRTGSSYRVRRSIDGVRTVTTIEASSDAEAIGRCWLLRAGVEIAGGATVLELLPRYIAAAPVAPTTINLYEHRIKTFAGSLDEMPANELTVADVRRWLSELGELKKPNGALYSANSIHGVRTATASLFKWAVRRGYISENPFGDLDRDDAISRVAPGMPAGSRSRRPPLWPRPPAMSTSG